jgi:glycosyltransferase involved in cell wall biosynthesis
MRIAQVAPLAESVPPKLYGGTERVVSWLTEELVALGHEVTLFASADSVTRARLVGICPRALRLSRPRPDPAVALTVLLEHLAARAAEFDVVHCHLDWIHLPLLRSLAVPVLTTLHGRLDIANLPNLMRLFPEVPFVSISENQRIPLAGANWLSTVYHGLPPNSLKPRFQQGSYLAFLGRITPEKGPDVAIRLAKAAGMKLRIAAKIPRGESRFYKQQIEPQLDGRRIRFVGEVDDRGKESFLGKAAALIFPIDWPEPFGLVMIEAMACGTPVIAFRRGSVPEIIDEGITGFVVENEAEALNAIGRIGQLDRHKIRETFERRFTARRMAEDYVRCYRNLIENSRPARSSDALVRNDAIEDGVTGVLSNAGAHAAPCRVSDVGLAAANGPPLGASVRSPERRLGPAGARNFS